MEFWAQTPSKAAALVNTSKNNYFRRFKTFKNEKKYIIYFHSAVVLRLGREIFTPWIINIKTRRQRLLPRLRKVWLTEYFCPGVAKKIIIYFTFLWFLWKIWRWIKFVVWKMFETEKWVNVGGITLEIHQLFTRSNNSFSVYLSWIFLDINVSRNLTVHV